MRLATLAAPLLILLTATAGQTQSRPQFPELTGPVVDLVDEIPADEEAKLDAELRDFRRRTGHQLQVVTLPDIGGDDIKSYGRALGEHWKIGRKGVDDGIILIHAIGERKVRIEVGRGAEPYLTDGMSIGIIDNTIIPLFKQKRFSDGIVEGSREIMKEAAITPEQRAEDARRQADQRARDAQAMRDGMATVGIWIGSIIAMIAGAFGIHRLATRGKRRRAREAEEARLAAKRVADAERARLRKIQEQEQREKDAEQARLRKIEEDAERERQRLRNIEEARRRAEAERLAIEKRTNMLAAMTPVDREAFLAKEHADKVERERLAAVAREEERRRAKERQEQQDREEEQRRIRRQREEREEEERRSRRRNEEAAAAAAAASSSSYNSTSYGSSSSSSSSSDSWSGGGGSFGGGGADGSY